VLVRMDVLLVEDQWGEDSGHRESLPVPYPSWLTSPMLVSAVTRARWVCHLLVPQGGIYSPKKPISLA